MKLSDVIKKIKTYPNWSDQYKTLRINYIGMTIKNTGDIHLEDFSDKKLIRLRIKLERKNYSVRIKTELIRALRFFKSEKGSMILSSDRAQVGKNESDGARSQVMTPTTPKPNSGHPGGFEISIIRTEDVDKIADAGQRSGKYYQLKSAAYNGIMGLRSEKKSILLRFSEPMDKKQREGALHAVKGIFYAKKIPMHVLFSTSENAIVVSKKAEKEAK